MLAIRTAIEERYGICSVPTRRTQRLRAGTVASTTPNGREKRDEDRRIRQAWKEEKEVAGLKYQSRGPIRQTVREALT
jgi:hypothetical protein